VSVEYPQFVQAGQVVNPLICGAARSLRRPRNRFARCQPTRELAYASGAQTAQDDSRRWGRAGEGRKPDPAPC
jgi:hypothetical protein